MQKQLALLSLAVLLAGCGSSPKTNFYMLSVIPGKSGVVTTSSPVQIAAVHIPPSLDRRQMVGMTSQTKVDISETNRWAAPLDEMMRNVLSQDLAASLPRGKVILPQAPAPADAGALVVTIAQFGLDANGRAKLSGSWTLLRGGSSTPVLERDIQLDGGPARDAESTVAAMSRALGLLAQEIATALAKTGL